MRIIAGARRLPQADARIRTGDPFITSEVLYQLSYVGEGADRSGRVVRSANPLFVLGGDAVPR
jgi:hypothetical protein